MQDLGEFGSFVGAAVGLYELRGAEPRLEDFGRF